MAGPHHRGFVIGVGGCTVVAVAGLSWPEVLASGALGFVALVLKWLDWFFLATVGGFVVLSIWLALGRHGKRRLGDEPAEFSRWGWWAMLFAAGMGSGLMFWGVAEPISHYVAPPVAVPRSAAAARHALVLADFHWGLHAWAIYCIAALVLAYFRFRHGTDYVPGAPLRSAFRGRWVDPVAKLADLVGVLAIAFGVAGAMGMGVLQMRSGLAVVLDRPLDSSAFAFAILGALTIAYMASASGPIERGIQWLSTFNVVLAVAFVGSLCVLGPTGTIGRELALSSVDYVRELFALTLLLEPWNDLGAWVDEWTLGYMIWWIAWAPFVGVFVARISQGRTIREFVAGVVFVPTLVSMVWFAVLGCTGIELEREGGQLAPLVASDVSRALFVVLGELPGTQAMSALALVLVFVFLVTSVDSATYVLGMISSGGESKPPLGHKFAWGITLALLAAALVSAGHVDVIKAVAILGAIPFTAILLLQSAALLRALSREPKD
ncbi:MAG TPA: BCCT family transporter [Nannocystaceae bacterium]|nr:BCCT family transporter [Nannocystaceae bacterium]